MKIAGTWTLLCVILFIGFWIRIQGVDTIPAGQFTETDAYLYYWQAQIVLENGQLPARDMHRWLPLGRDHGQSLNLYPHAIAYMHKAIAFMFSNVTLYDVILYAPTVCFSIGVGIFYLFLYRTYGLIFSSSVGILLVTLPGTIERSTVGFGDRDSWCLMLGILAVTTYLESLRAQHSHKRFLWTFASGFSVFLGGISWEGFGVFLSIILVVELWRFLASQSEESLKYYLTWVCIFVPTLYLASPVYRSGQGFATHLFALMIGAPLTLLGIRCFRYLLITKGPLIEKFYPYSRILSLTLVLTSFLIALGYVLNQYHTFDSTTVPLSQNQLMKSIGELESPQFRYWVSRYGSIFIMGCIGVIVASNHLWKNHRGPLTMSFVLFSLTTFFRQPLDALCGASLDTFFFFIALTGCVIGILLIGWQQNGQPKNFTDIIFAAMIAWFLIWVALTRDAKRYDFFIGIPLAFFTSQLIRLTSKILSRRIRLHLPYRLLKTCIATFVLIGIMFFPPIGAHTYRAVYAATRMRTAAPGQTNVALAFQWMRKNLPDTAVVAARWVYGSQLNVLAGVKTIIDQDHYLQHWVHLYYQSIHRTHSAREALEFLRTHNATHLMLTQKHPPEAIQEAQLSGALVPVYPTNSFLETDVKVWEIHYPPYIQPNPKYLATEPEE